MPQINNNRFYLPTQQQYFHLAICTINQIAPLQECSHWVFKQKNFKYKVLGLKYFTNQPFPFQTEHLVTGKTLQAN